MELYPTIQFSPQSNQEEVEEREMITFPNNTKTGSVRTYVVQTDPVFSLSDPSFKPANHRAYGRIITEYQMLSICYQTCCQKARNPLFSRVHGSS